MSGKKKENAEGEERGDWRLEIGCMLLSAGAFAAVIYFSNAGRDEAEQEGASQQTKEDSATREEETKDTGK